MDHRQMTAAMAALDRIVPAKLTILIGGGAAFLLAHGIPLSTMDIDAIPYHTTLKGGELDRCIKQVAADLRLPPDWFNTYFGTFTYSLPKDYGSRLVRVFNGKRLTADALGKEDLLIMKCFAGREKDIMHAALLLKKGVDTELAATHLCQCAEEGLPRGEEALDFFYQVCEQAGVDV